MTATKSLKFENLKIQFSNSITGNFLRLPHSIINVLESTDYAIQEFGIGVHFHNSDTPIVHLGWDGHDSGSNENTVLINPILASVYDINQKFPLVDLYIERYDQTRLATEVYVIPETSDDWEIIDSNAMKFQNGEILHQTRIVTPGETLICYLEGIVTKFKIDKVVPSLTSARLTDGSLVVVAPKVNKTRFMKVEHAHNDDNMLKSDTYQIIKKVVLRSTICEVDCTKKKPFVVYVNNGVLLPSQKGYLSIIQCSLRQLKKSDSDNKTVDVLPKKIGVSIKCNSLVPENHICLSSYLWEAFFAHPTNGAKMKLEFLQICQTSMIPGENVKVIIKYFGKDFSSKSEKSYRDLLKGS